MSTQKVESVTSVASSATDELPPEFIRPENEQPRYTTFQGAGPEVPVIDFKDETDPIDAVNDAAIQWGLFQVINHSIPDEVIADLQRVGRQFFELPESEKEPYARDPACKCIEGYGSRLKNGWVDHLFNKISPPSAVDLRFWPKNPPDYRTATEEYEKHLHKVADRLFKVLSLGLGLGPDDLKVSVGGEELVYNLKINYYPPCPRPDIVLGVPAHTDLSALTILVPNQVQGLQVCKDDNWYDVAYIPNALIIHIGDQIEILSNGKYKAVLHRSVVNKDSIRMSWPVFMEPPTEFEVGPHPKLVGDENPPKYKTKKFGEYAYCKLNNIPQ